MEKNIAMDTIIREYGPANGRHWFDKDTMRFFRTHLPQGGYATPNGKRVYFVTSEVDPSHKLAYSVRVFDRVTREVDTIEPFHGYTKSTADRKAQRLAQSNDTVPRWRVVAQARRIGAIGVYFGKIRYVHAKDRKEAYAVAWKAFDNEGYETLHMDFENLTEVE